MAGWWPPKLMVMQIMMIRCLMLAVFALGFCSCGRQAEAPVAPNPEPHAPVAQPIPPRNDSIAAPMLAQPAAADLDDVLTQLTREVRKWIVRHQRPPKNFEEFAASATVTIPPAPPGKKFALGKPMRVIVVNR